MSVKSLKYYIYVSSVKVNMLYSQIPRKLLDGVAAEVKVNFGVASSALTQKAFDETIYSKLSAVVHYINKHESIGSIDKPEKYFHGVATVRWGIFDSEGFLVLFTGATNRSIFGLGGSSIHIIGSKPKAETPYVSATPFLVDALSEELQLRILKEHERANMTLLVNQGRSSEKMALWAIEHANQYMDAPEQKVEFFAKRLLYSEQASKDGKNILLATPLYVALME